MKKLLLLLLLLISGSAEVLAQGNAIGCQQYCQQHRPQQSRSNQYCQARCDTMCATNMACAMRSTPLQGGGTSYPCDTCQVVSREHHLKGTVQINKFYCLDSTNFSVSALQALPYSLRDNESVRFNICLHCPDGKPHTTQVKAVTNQGELSWEITMQGTPKQQRLRKHRQIHNRQ